MTVFINTTTARTLGDLKARIADELDRPDLSSQIALAIDDAITEAASTRFWFNEVRGLVIPAITGQEYYGSDDFAAMTQIDAVYYVNGAIRRNVWPANQLDLNTFEYGPGNVGEPSWWSQYGQFLRLYPIPNMSYTVMVDGVTRFPPLASDAQSNAWTTSAEKLIRAIAKRELLANVIRDFDEAQAQQLLVTNAMKEFRDQTYDRSATGQMAEHG